MSQRLSEILPQGWIKARISEIVFPYETIQPKKEPTKEFIYVDIGSIDNSRYVIHQPRVFLGKDAPSRARRVVQKGDILFSTVRTYLKKIAIPVEVKTLSSSRGTRAILRAGEAVHKDFLFHLVLSDGFIRQISGAMDGTLYPAIKDSDLYATKIPLPPLNEQHRIVAKIEALTARSRKAREALDAIPALLDQFRQSVLAAAFRGDLTADWREQNPDVESAETLLERIREERRARWEAAELEKMKAKAKVLKNDKWKERYKAPLDFDAPDLPKLHSNWTWMSADECTSLITDGEHATPKRTKEGVYLLSARNVLNGEISLEKVDYISEELHQKLNQRLQLQFGDVLLSCSGTVGRSCTVPEGLECSFVRSVAILKPLLNMGEYLSLSIRSPVVQNQIERKKTQTAQSNLFQGRIKVLAFPLAPIGEQTEILRRINDLMVIADAIKKKYSEIVVEQTQLDQSILAKAFRGELVSQDPNDEPASVLLERIRAEREKTLKKGEGERLKGKGKQQVQISLPLDKVES